MKHRFAILGALCAALLCVLSMTGCGAVTSVLDVVFGVEEKVTTTTDPVTGVVKVTTEIIKRPGLADMAGSFIPWGTALAGALGAFWANARKKNAVQTASNTYDKFKAVVAGLVSLVDGKEGNTFTKEDLYAAIDGAAKVYTDNSAEFAAVVAALKAEIRGADAASAS